MQLPGQLASGFRAPPRGDSRETLIFAKLVFAEKPGLVTRAPPSKWCYGA